MAEKDIHIAVENDGGQRDQGKALAKSWLIEVKDTFLPGHKRRQPSKNVCIYRVPHAIKVCAPEAYEPTVISLGPYHHKMNAKLSAMDEHKLEAVDRTLKRLEGKTIYDLTSEIRNLENEIRECYEEAIEWDGETLSWMLAMDVCFILEYISERDMDCFSLVFQKSKNQTRFAIVNDIMKMENQIPLFLLIIVLKLEFDDEELAVLRLAKILSALEVFKGFPFSMNLSVEKVETRLKRHILLEGKGARHLLDLSRRVITDSLTNSSNPNSAPCAGEDYTNGLFKVLKWMNVCSNWLPQRSERHGVGNGSTPRADLLKKAGIKFKVGKARFDNRRLRSSTLFLPEITVDDGTDTVLRNLMAFEECQRWSTEITIISHYVRLVEDLIDTERDVSILKKANIIKSSLGSDEEIANIFNHLGKGITFGSVEIFEKVGNQAREHYMSRWKVWMSLLRQEHCSNPWYIISLVAAVILLAMTVVQTIYSVKN